LALKAATLGKMMQNIGQYAVQGHSKSTISNIYLALKPRYYGLLVQISLSTEECLYSTRTFGVNPVNSDCEIWPQETTNILLSYSVKCISISSTVYVSHECDRRRDGRTDIVVANAALNYVARPK